MHLLYFSYLSLMRPKSLPPSLGPLRNWSGNSKYQFPQIEVLIHWICLKFAQETDQHVIFIMVLLLVIVHQFVLRR